MFNLDKGEGNAAAKGSLEELGTDQERLDRDLLAPNIEVLQKIFHVSGANGGLKIAPTRFQDSPCWAYSP